MLENDMHSLQWNGVGGKSFIVLVESNEWNTKCDEIFGNQIDDLILIPSKHWIELKQTQQKSRILLDKLFGENFVWLKNNPRIGIKINRR